MAVVITSRVLAAVLTVRVLAAVLSVALVTGRVLRAALAQDSHQAAHERGRCWCEHDPRDPRAGRDDWW